MRLARAPLAITLTAALGVWAAACTSGATPDCEGGVCGYGLVEGGPEEGGDGNASEAGDDASTMDSSAAGEAGDTGTPPLDTGSPPEDSASDAPEQ